MDKLKGFESKWFKIIALLLAVCLSIFQLWQGFTAGLAATYMRPLFLSWVLLLIFIHYPLCKNAQSARYIPGRLLDLICCLAVLYVGYQIISFDYNSITHMLYGLSTKYLLVGIIMIVLSLEATRRSVGSFMTLIGVVFILYCLFGNFLPDAIANRGFSLERIIRFQIYTTSGIFGSPLGIAAGVVFIYILFGAFLEVTGAGKFFIDLAYATTGKYRGGPAKASVIASALLGSISGSAIANTATTGSLTIPMMKKLGYKAHQAGGITAAASTGGQIMPPIMGAGAFIMAEFTNIPYNTIVLMAIAPAILYFVSTMLYVHIMACKLNLKPMDERVSLLHTLGQGIHFILPLILITVLLILNYSPVLVGITGCFAIVVTSMLRQHTRINFRGLLKGMQKAAMIALPISVACATAGIVVGVIGQTGLGLQFTEFVISLAYGHLWLALILVAFSALILGMGLPVTAAYIVISVMAAPALMTMGLPLIVAHMIVFWLSQTSNVTPPIALAAFTAAGIAVAKPMPTAMTAFKLAQGLFIIPLMMAYSDLLWLEGTGILSFVLAIVMTTALIVTFAACVEGYLFTSTKVSDRSLFILAAVCLLFQYAGVRELGFILCLIAGAINLTRYYGVKERAEITSGVLRSDL